MSRTMKKTAGKVVVSGGLALAALGMACGPAHAFNPQPDPPGKPVAANPDPSNRPITVGVNPQPARPGRSQISARG